ncbi:hypothetical protein [Sessilibacter corallicola]|uniref:hypothetical protein n=1 Tax=Sessilibacter corallicola TaxID=2904075 RepID=UPI001E4080FF|nr:hypothetical protein [Sessilibacter corallicola]MCE2029063.1 hypothetical protein [Sessilibacter corallicola]
MNLKILVLRILYLVLGVGCAQSHDVRSDGEELDHPLVNVEYKMSVLDLMAKLKVLASMMTKTEVKIR